LPGCNKFSWASYWTSFDTNSAKRQAPQSGSPMLGAGALVRVVGALVAGRTISRTATSAIA
jgi:hypothetical protein